MLHQRTFALLLTIGLTGCGDANFNQILENSERRDAMDQLLIEAQYDYDQGDYGDALKKAQKAYSIRPNGERATTLLSYIHLSLAGLDTFQLAKNLVGQSDDEAGGEDDKTARTFSLLSDVMGLTKTDLTAMSQEVRGDTLPVYVPKTADQARISDSEIIKNLHAAISYLCPLISDEAKLLGDNADGMIDNRHASCENEPGERRLSAQSHFAWSLAHLGEAIAFYSLIFYQSADANEPNIVERGQRLDQFKDQPVKYVEEIGNFADLVDTVLPTDSDNAMLNAIFNDLETTSAGFGVIAGLPDEVTKSVSDAIANTRGKVDKLENSGGSGGNVENEALKNSLTKKLGSKLNKQIEDVENSEEGLSEEDRNKVCCSYLKINSDPDNLPDNCPAYRELVDDICPDIDSN
jgi:tetratricopeptide (TPR) repeat protein